MLLTYEKAGSSPDASGPWYIEDNRACLKLVRPAMALLNRQADILVEHGCEQMDVPLFAARDVRVLSRFRCVWRNIPP